MTRKIKMIFNPIANLGRAWPVASSLLPIVNEAGGADWAGTVYPGHAVELAYQAACDGFELVIALGGDGTVHEVINGLMRVPENQRPKLGIVPVGTGNDFAGTLGIPKQPDVALRHILEGTSQPIDIGMIEDLHGRREFWNNTIGIGFDAAINYRSRRITLFHGFLIYFLALLQTILLNFTPFNIKAKIDGREWNDRLLMLTVANGRREGGGFILAPNALQNDGLLDFCAVNTVSRPVMLYTIPFFLKGQQERLKYVHMGQFKQLELSSDSPLIVHSDGEIFAGLGSTVQQLKIQIIPSALQVYI
jgi:YegS/Rv2252/BmrU family lipid kinase